MKNKAEKVSTLPPYELPHCWAFATIGELIANEGVFTDGDNTVTVIVAESERSSLSVAEAVIVCVLAERVDVENVGLLPMTPSMFETQDRLLEMLPSSVSMAEPVNVIESPKLNEEPPAGAEMVTSGAVFPGVDDGWEVNSFEKKLSFPPVSYAVIA